MSKNVTRQIVVIVALVATLAVNGLASSLPLNDVTTGEVSDRFDVYFVPAGYVFSIWGLIYLALIGYAVYQALPGQREDPYLHRIGYLFVLSCVANIAWLFLWHYQVFPLTIVAMLALLLFLIAMYLRLGIGRIKVGRAFKWLVHVPFSIYLGWITVATVANATSLLDYLGWGEVREMIHRAMEKTIAAKTVTYDLERLMEGATLLKCSEFGQALIDNMD